MAPATALSAPLGAYPTVRGQHGPAFTDHEIVQRNPRVVLIFWGWSASEEPLLLAEQDLFTRLPGSAYGGILAQYGVHDDEQLAGTVRDPGYPGWQLTRGDFQREILKASRWAHTPTTFNTQWIVLAPPGANSANFPGECGEHGQFRPDRNSRWYIYSIVWAYQQPGCGSSVADEVASTSHEWAEGATNPLADNNKGWWIKVGKAGLQEIADICDWQYVQPWGSDGPTVQALWSNASEGPNYDRGCVGSAAGG